MTHTTWPIDSLDRIGGYPAQVLGSPKPVTAPVGGALEFDGAGDALIVPVHPLAGASEFTVEIIFRPDPGGLQEQRFLHLQEDGSESRILIETRLIPGDRWFLDTFIRSGDDGHTLYAEGHPHPLGRWYHAALVCAGGQMNHYVDGRSEIGRPVSFQPQGAGKTSIGVRINRICWFRGAIATARFTPRALSVDEFLRVSL
jgi:hypothetical protein